MKVLIVIPTYNERENVERIIEEIFKFLPSANILIVDDNSPDGTSEIVREIMKKDKRVNLILKEKKEGLGKAYKTGFKWGIEKNYDIIIQMDADFSHSPEVLPEFIKEIEKGYDLIIGSRYLNGVSVVNWPIKRLLLSYFANVYARILTGVPVRDLTGGFKVWKREVLENLPWEKIDAEGYGFQIETTFYAKKLGYRIKEYPIIFIERRVGISKMSKKIIFEAFFLVIKLFFLRFLKGR
ncbi:MAG: polyprenol monophosphomannose synthase [candidate division WOR-3 bacterium]